MIMTAKDVHLAAKRPDGWEYLMKRFCFLTDTELYEAIQKATPLEADSLLRTIEKKRRKLERNQCKAAGRAEKCGSKPMENADNTEVSQEEICMEREQEEMAMETVELEQLEALEKEISSNILQLEGKYKRLAAERKEKVVSIQNVRSEIEEMRNIVREKQSLISRWYEEYTKAAEEMKTINQEKRDWQNQLEETRQKIELLQIVNLFIYPNGKIEVDNGEIPEVSSEDVNSELNELIQMDEAGEMTLNEIRSVAKLKRIADVYKEHGRKYETVFESESSQMLWDAINAM